MESKLKSSDKDITKVWNGTQKKDNLMLDDSINGDSNHFYQSNSKLKTNNKLPSNDFIDNSTESNKKREKSCISNIK